MSELRDRVIAEITRKTERDEQKRVGPSEIGNPCDKCLGRALMNERPDQDFSLYPWIGTAVHYYMEHNTFEEFRHELKLYVGDIPGYGPVKGTTDMEYVETSSSGDEAVTVTDWKIVGNKKIKQYRTSGVPQQYRFQAMTYARGLELEERPVKNIAIVFIPRDSGNVRDIWVHEEEYQPDMAEAALDRAGELWDWLQEDGNHWRDLQEDYDCYQCNFVF